MQFNPEAFMQSTIQDANATTLKPCPVGEWAGQSTKVDIDTGEIGKGERIGEPWASLIITWEITDPAAKAEAGRDKLTSRQRIFLDLTPEGMLDMSEGKNVALGRTREALGQNQPGVAWNPNMLAGQYAICKVGHRPDPKDSSIIYDEVQAIRKP